MMVNDLVKLQRLDKRLKTLLKAQFYSVGTTQTNNFTSKMEPSKYSQTDQNSVEIMKIDAQTQIDFVKGLEDEKEKIITLYDLKVKKNFFLFHVVGSHDHPQP